MTPRRERTIDRPHSNYPIVFARWYGGMLALTFFGHNQIRLRSAHHKVCDPMQEPAQICCQAESCARCLTQPSRPCDFQPIARSRAASRRAQSKSQFVALSGASSCTGTYGGVWKTPLKATDSQVGRPTHLSAMLSPTSANLFFGLKIQRLILRLLQIAACAKPNDFLAAIANGPALLRQRSSLKFSLVRKCATSV
jgi:hypothetical protein